MRVKEGSSQSHFLSCLQELDVVKTNVTVNVMWLSTDIQAAAIATELPGKRTPEGLPYHPSNLFLRAFKRRDLFLAHTQKRNFQFMLRERSNNTTKILTFLQYMYSFV